MKIRFTEQAAEVLTPPCFSGDIEQALQLLAQTAVARATPAGATWLNVAGRNVPLQVYEYQEAGQLTMLIDLCPTGGNA